MSDARGGSTTERTAVLIPCYNAGAAVRPVVVRALEQTRHVIVVDDGSTDRCTAPLASLPVTLITFPRNRGKGFALLAGFRAALAMPAVEAVVVVDADGQHDPGEVPVLCGAWEASGADLVLGSRHFDRRQVPFWSWFGNVVTVRVMACLFGTSLPDTQTGFRLHSRRFLAAVIESIPGGRYETEMAIVLKALRDQYTVITVPIQTVYEAGNPTSHFRRLRDSFRIYRTLAMAWFRRRRPA